MIRDDAVRAAALAKVREFARTDLAACRIAWEMDSPIEGADGNREFLLCLEKRPD